MYSLSLCPSHILLFFCLYTVSTQLQRQQEILEKNMFSVGGIIFCRKSSKHFHHSIIFLKNVHIKVSRLASALFLQREVAVFTRMAGKLLEVLQEQGQLGQDNYMRLISHDLSY